MSSSKQGVAARGPLAPRNPANPLVLLLTWQLRVLFVEVPPYATEEFASLEEASAMWLRGHLEELEPLSCSDPRLPGLVAGPVPYRSFVSRDMEVRLPLLATYPCYRPSHATSCHKLVSRKSQLSSLFNEFVHAEIARFSRVKRTESSARQQVPRAKRLRADLADPTLQTVHNHTSPRPVSSPPLAMGDWSSDEGTPASG